MKQKDQKTKNDRSVRTKSASTRSYGYRKTRLTSCVLGFEGLVSKIHDIS